MFPFQIPRPSPGARAGRSRGPAGFTLVEMLVVTAVMATLAAMLLPSVSRARSTARAVHCLSNLRQLGLGLRMYAETDSMGRLPVDPVGDQEPAWVYSLIPHLGSVDGVRICPSDAFGAARRKWNRTSYVRNQYTSRDLAATGDGTGMTPGDAGSVGPDGQPLVLHPSSLRMASYRRPSDTFLAFEGSNVGVLFPPALDDRAPVPAFDDHTHPDTWIFGWAHVLAD
ncbi:MAG: type II secretion system protein, partial [Verrucomicrobiales bacterium]|nr:type II secretion system protein [Verrucomicrobiales bacterium]